MNIFGQKSESLFDNIITNTITIGGETNVSGFLNATDVQTTSVFDATRSSYIELGASNIDVNATTFTVNGSAFGGGDVVGPASSTSNTIVRFDGETGKLLKESTAILSTEITALNAGGSAYNDVQDIQTVFHSAGWISGGAITNNGNGTINVAAGEGFLRDADTTLSDLYFIAWPAATSVVLTNLAFNYVKVSWNAGTPIVAVSLTDLTSNDKFTLATVYRNGTTLHITEAAKHKVVDHASSMIKRMESLQYIAKSDDGGSLVSEVGTRRLLITAGQFWLGLSDFTLASINTNVSDTFFYYYNRTAYVSVPAQTTIDNTNYDLNGVLTPLNNNQYGVHWVYKGSDNDTYVIYGIGSYTLTDAENVGKPTLTPAHFEKHSILIAKIIILKGSATITRILSAFEKPIGTVTTSINTVNGTGTDNAIVRFDANGNTIQNSGVIIADTSNDITGVGSIDATSYKVNGTTGSILRNPNNVPSSFAAPTSAGAVITSGQNNILIGSDAGALLTNNGQNVFIGANSGTKNNTNYNVGVGFNSMQFITGLDNVFIGSACGQGVDTLSTGFNNVGCGSTALFNITSGSYNTAVGRSAGNLTTSGSNNTFLGYDADGVNTFNNQTAIGYNVKTDVANEIVLGNPDVTHIRSMAAADLGTTGNKFKNLYLSGINDATSYKVGGTTGVLARNIGVNNYIISTNSDASYTGIDTINILIGTDAGTSLTTGAFYNCLIGNRAGELLASHEGNTIIGNNSGKTCFSNYNTILGSNSCTSAAGSSGGNCIIGEASSNFMTTAGYNCIMGFTSAAALTSGNENICIGKSANLAATFDNQIAIGTGAVTTLANTCKIGNASMASISTMGNGICDLGGSSNKFKDLYLSGNITANKAYGTFAINSSAVTTGSTSFTAVTYTTTSAALLSNFTHASPAGTLTYTGTVVKTFRICCSCTITPSAATSSLYNLAIGKNSSTSAATGSLVSIEIDNVKRNQISLSMIVILDPNDVIRLITSNSAAVNLTIGFLSFNVVEV